jgi:hypothetical protein
VIGLTLGVPNVIGLTLGGHSYTGRQTDVEVSVVEEIIPKNLEVSKHERNQIGGTRWPPGRGGRG